jgi:hypothetical protein
MGSERLDRRSSIRTDLRARPGARQGPD